MGNLETLGKCARAMNVSEKMVLRFLDVYGN